VRRAKNGKPGTHPGAARPRSHLVAGGPFTPDAINRLVKRQFSDSTFVFATERGIGGRAGFAFPADDKPGFSPIPIRTTRPTLKEQT
jgi:hypothetical protein